MPLNCPTKTSEMRSVTIALPFLATTMLESKFEIRQERAKAGAPHEAIRTTMSIAELPNCRTAELSICENTAEARRRRGFLDFDFWILIFCDANSASGRRTSISLWCDNPAVLLCV